MTGNAADLISDRVVRGGAETRLKEVALAMRTLGASHCVVLEGPRFVGVIRLEEVAACTNAGTRILADLLSSANPVKFTTAEPAATIASLFKKNRLREAVVVDSAGDYVGLATSESVLNWALEGLEVQQTEALNARNRLEMITQSREEFIRAVSHELRTPLNPVMMIATDGAVNTAYPPEVREQFEMIATHALLEAELIDRLIDVVNARKGSLRLDGKAVNFREMLGNAVEAVRKVSARRILWDATTVPAPMQVMGDGVKLSQAFRSLIECMIEMTPGDGEVAVEISPVVQADVVTLVCASGGAPLTGIDLAHVFGELSLRTELSGRRLDGKTSMGLSLAHAVIGLHAGSLEPLEETSGRTGFKVTLPMVR